MRLGKEYYEKVISYVLDSFAEIFRNDIVFVKKQVSIEHMGYFKIQYKYLPLKYDIVFESDRNVFDIEIYDNEGAKNILYRIEKYNSELSFENIKKAIQKLKTVMEKNDMCFYIYKNKKLYKKINGGYLRVRDLNELR